MYDTIEEAQFALGTAGQDVIADHGEEMLEQAWGDIVHSIADCCPEAVAAELIRRNL